MIAKTKEMAAGIPTQLDMTYLQYITALKGKSAANEVAAKLAAEVQGMSEKKQADEEKLASLGKSLEEKMAEVLKGTQASLTAARKSMKSGDVKEAFAYLSGEKSTSRSEAVVSGPSALPVLHVIDYSNIAIMYFPETREVVRTIDFEKESNRNDNRVFGLGGNEKTYYAVHYRDADLLFAIDKETGEVKAAPLERPMKGFIEGKFVPRTVASGSGIYATSPEMIMLTSHLGDVQCVDVEKPGILRWEKRYDCSDSHALELEVGNGICYVAHDRGVSAMKLDNCDTLWCASKDTKNVRNIIQKDGTLYVASRDNIKALDDITGKEKWHSSEEGFIAGVGKDRVYVAEHVMLHSVDKHSGKTVNKTKFSDLGYISTVLEDGSSLYVAGMHGVIQKLGIDPKTGESQEVKWTSKVMGKSEYSYPRGIISKLSTEGTLLRAELREHPCNSCNSDRISDPKELIAFFDLNTGEKVELKYKK